jgi:hypothetical protein
MAFIQRCMVLNCDCPADEVWCTSASYQGWVVEWHVCSDHYEQLFSGEKSAAVYATTSKGQRWLVMGDDLGARGTLGERSLPEQRAHPTLRRLRMRH